MRLFRRKHDIIALKRSLDRIERKLHLIAHDDHYLPTPKQIQAMEAICFKLPEMIDYSLIVQTLLIRRMRGKTNPELSPKGNLRLILESLSLGFLFVLILWQTLHWILSLLLSS